ncbi:MAG TPA: glycoside hydrolase family 20 zincin-like fold domain-containing protein [Mobilitalea sp.]|nr:glycoside hydrolase family 20 zincin-like fold domain-containing protein [Mobilitalea sp.]
MYILPAPHRLIYNQQEFIIKYNSKIVLSSALGFHELNYAHILQKQIEDSLCFILDITKTEQEETNGIFLQISDDLKPEEYHVRIQKDRIRLIGGNSNALLYAVQTLRQMISQKGAVLPGLEIEDYPEIKNRGFYYDVTRGRIPTLKTLKALADKMSYYKLNQLQLYIEHSFLIKNFSEVWRDDTPLTPEEILELDRYCNSLNIELVPSIASFGHLHKLLSTKTYEELCELEDSNKDIFSYVGRMEHHTVDVTNEKSFEMLKTMLLELIPLFSSKLFNICADETFDLGKGKSRKVADDIGTDRMYIEFLKKLCKLMKDNGKQIMFWGDVIIAKPEAIKELPEDIICLHWDYCTNASDVNVKKLKDLGVTQYLCPGVHGWRRLINHYHNAYENVRIMCKYAYQYKAEGLLNTDWGDYGHINHPEFSTVGMIYGAAFSWNSNIPEYDEINRQISALEYLDPTESFVAIISKLTSKDGFLWNHVVQYKELCQKTDSKEKQKEYFNEVELESVLQSNQMLAEAVDEIYRMLPKLDAFKRNVVKAYLVAAKGMQLFNTLGGTTMQYVHNITNPLATEPLKLAVDLEYWFKDYKDIWRGGSKESELFRLQEVIIWYADYLREM